MMLQQLFILSVTLLIFLFILNDTKKRNMSKNWALISFFNLIGLLIYIVSRKPLSNNTILNADNTPNNIINSPSSTDSTIPETCPHCHSPNSKKIRLCEWCGNQIV
jgi:hypothetical protein